MFSLVFSLNQVEVVEMVEVYLQNKYTKTPPPSPFYVVAAIAKCSVRLLTVSFSNLDNVCDDFS